LEDEDNMADLLEDKDDEFFIKLIKISTPEQSRA